MLTRDLFAVANFLVSLVFLCFTAFDSFRAHVKHFAVMLLLYHKKEYTAILDP